MNPPPLATIGYEGTTIGAVCDALCSAGVAVLIDVRAVPLSRKPGFSKRQLAASLEERGIRYVHLRDLGTPKAGRDAARRGDTTTMRRIFAAHLATDEARAALGLAASLANAAPGCLLCFERDATRCHRRLVAEALHWPDVRDLTPALPDINAGPGPRTGA